MFYFFSSFLSLLFSILSHYKFGVADLGISFPLPIFVNRFCYDFFEFLGSEKTKTVFFPNSGSANLGF